MHLCTRSCREFFRPTPRVPARRALTSLRTVSGLTVSRAPLCVEKMNLFSIYMIYQLAVAIRCRMYFVPALSISNKALGTAASPRRNTLYN